MNVATDRSPKALLLSPSLRLSLRLSLWLSLLLAAVLSCDGGGTDPDIVTAEFLLEGTVRSANGGPIAGALVRFGSGGHFSLPIVLDSATTDVSGHFVIRDSLQYSRKATVTACSFLWVTAEAPGYVSSSYEDSRYRVTCDAGSRAMTFTLQPAP